MKLSKNSWHYRLYKFVSPHNEEPTDLCQYVRSLMFHSFMVSFIIAFLFGLVAATAVSISNLIFDWLSPEVGLFVNVIAFVVGVLLSLALLIYLFSKAQDCLKNGPRKPNIWFEYLKAKKAKFCPIIDWDER